MKAGEGGGQLNCLHKKIKRTVHAFQPNNSLVITRIEEKNIL